MSYITVSDADYGFLDPASLAEKGRDLAERYRSNAPFPHIVIDDFITPALLDACLAAFPSAPDPDSASFDRAQERYKTSYNPDHLPARARSFFYSLNSRPFIQFLENMTGIKGLLPDPYFLGGGFHETKEGGHLSVHADFNIHPILKLERRLNLLLYLNKDWRIDYGGALELWDPAMQAKVQEIAPDYNRCVVFSTTATSYHGHPVPVAHPDKAPRRSLALYYYTARIDETARAYTTQFRRRPASEDAVDWRVKGDEIVNDLLPPILNRTVRRLARRLKRSVS
ncbi:MAG: 2OG-Fe(II) oxygenase [Amphiplicatus sp.]